MPIDVSKALGGEVRGGTASWTRDDVILYHLGVGAGARPTDPGELEYTYEKNLKVLPSYGVIPAFRSLAGIANVPGLQFNPALLLHGEQDLEIHRPIPVEATVNTSGKVTAIYDKGKAAVVVLETVSRLTSGGSGDSADPLFTNRFSLFLRGEGGFGGVGRLRHTPSSRRPQRQGHDTFSVLAAINRDHNVLSALIHIRHRVGVYAPREREFQEHLTGRFVVGVRPRRLRSLPVDRGEQ